MSDYHPGVYATLAAMTGEMDTYTPPCPTCGGQLRAEVITEWRPIAEAVEMLGVTVDQIRASGVKFDIFGRVKAAVPYITCMHCGMHADASHQPTEQERER